MVEAAIIGAVADWTFVAGLSHDLPLAYVIAATTVAFAAAITAINQLGILFDLPLVVSPVEKFDYGLVYDGTSTAFDHNNENVALQLAISLFNATPWPMKYDVKRFDLVVDNRTPADATWLNTGGYISPHSRRRFNGPSFPKERIKDCIGKTIEGTLEFEIHYGPANGETQRVLKMKLRLNLKLEPDKSHPSSDIILSESDEQFFS
jgi:hypothetical protein